MSSVYDIAVNRIDGTPTTLDAYKGEVLLLVNVASECGLTPQYEGLEKLYEQFHDRGFEVLGFPANEFGAQEPGSNADIHAFCTTRFGVKFPMFEKIVVKGPDQHPLYKTLTSAIPTADNGGDDALAKRLESAGLGSQPGEIGWNFEKFLVDRQGEIVARFAPNVTPQSAQVTEAIERLL